MDQLLAFSKNMEDYVTSEMYSENALN